MVGKIPNGTPLKESFRQLFCINLGPFLSTAQCIEKDFNYCWTRHISWCIS